MAHCNICNHQQPISSGGSGTRAQGQGMVEYALILSLVAVVCIVVVTLFGTSIQSTICRVVVQIGNPGEARACVMGGITEGQRAPDTAPIEAVINPSAASMVQNVVFRINGTTVATEAAAKYCMAGGNETCNPYSFASLPAGNHVLEIIVNMTNGRSTSQVIHFVR